MKRIFASLLPIPAMCFIAWAGGYDFDTRNWVTGYMAFVAMIICGAIYFSPGRWEE